ncbi:MAG: DMT family transporter [Sphaerochaetaceae bacterium]|jgi:drug/metabolite transporter (DMT)-like permease|nr:DMT family transporter [Sphaerochaetaceae bacterium]MDY0372313.1 DMT family transporter [Sphaerochaetaceae bacterium]
MNKHRTIAHGLALTTIVVWGTTFIATKILLEAFTPIEILLVRFIMGFLGLALYDAIINRSSRQPWNLRQELLFAGAGLTGVTMYYLLENIALTMTYASNVGILVSVAPLTTALLAPFFLKEEPLKSNLILGFIIASVGVCLVMFNGNVEFQLSLAGDALALTATLGWAIYCILLRKIDTTRYKVSTYTKKILFYGIIFMLPFVFIGEFSISTTDFTGLNTILFLFLGFGASGACFVSWNSAIKTLGVFKTSAYIYLTPLITLFTAAIVLDEPITIMALGGCLLILVGLYLSERKNSPKQCKKTIIPESAQ